MPNVVHKSDAYAVDNHSVKNEDVGMIDAHNNSILGIDIVM